MRCTFVDLLRCLVVLSAASSGLAAKQAVAQSPVSLELVLAVDCSLSVNDAEFELQMQGIAAAFRTPDVINLISLQDGVAVTLLQWGGWTSSKHTIPWRLLKSRESIFAFAAEVDAVQRENLGYHTAIGTALAAGLAAIEGNAYAGRRRKIDISGDGRSNAGPEPRVVRQDVLAKGVTINGLAVRTDVPDLDDYYGRHVVAGPGAFVISASDYRDFARAIRLKLMREIAPVISRQGKKVTPG